MKQLLIAAAATMLFACTMAHRVDAKPRHSHAYVDANGGDARLLGSRPADCPSRWCGCGLRKFLGIADKSLNLAWNWAKKFPRTYAHDGAVAARHGHVMQLVSHVAGTIWMVRSYNDYRRQGWIRARDIRGYVLVDVSARAAAL